MNETKSVNQQLTEALSAALPVLRNEYMKLAEKYEGTPYENDASYLAVKARYENAKEALAYGAANPLEQNSASVMAEPTPSWEWLRDHLAIFLAAVCSRQQGNMDADFWAELLDAKADGPKMSPIAQIRALTSSAQVKQ